jgi:hypothetical protein
LFYFSLQKSMNLLVGLARSFPNYLLIITKLIEINQSFRIFSTQ